jgi:hypothetical protein
LFPRHNYHPPVLIIIIPTTSSTTTYKQSLQPSKLSRQSARKADPFRLLDEDFEEAEETFSVRPSASPPPAAASPRGSSACWLLNLDVEEACGTFVLILMPGSDRQAEGGEQTPLLSAPLLLCEEPLLPPPRSPSVAPKEKPRLDIPKVALPVPRRKRKGMSFYETYRRTQNRLSSQKHRLAVKQREIALDMRIESLTERNRALEMAADALRDQIKLLKEALVSRAKKEHQSSKSSVPQVDSDGTKKYALTC